MALQRIEYRLNQLENNWGEVARKIDVVFKVLDLDCDTMDQPPSHSTEAPHTQSGDCFYRHKKRKRPDDSLQPSEDLHLSKSSSLRNMSVGQGQVPLNNKRVPPFDNDEDSHDNDGSDPVLASEDTELRVSPAVQRFRPEDANPTGTRDRVQQEWLREIMAKFPSWQEDDIRRGINSSPTLLELHEQTVWKRDVIPTNSNVQWDYCKHLSYLIQSRGECNQIPCKECKNRVGSIGRTQGRYAGNLCVSLRQNQHGNNLKAAEGACGACAWHTQSKCCHHSSKQERPKLIRVVKENGNKKRPHSSVEEGDDDEYQ